MPGAVFLRGETVTLRTIEEEDVEFLRDTINDPTVREGLPASLPFNGEQEREYFEEQISSDENANLAICYDSEAQRASEQSSGARREQSERLEDASGEKRPASGQGPRDSEIIGTINLHDLNERAGHCEIGLWLAPEYHGEGFGTEASRLVTQYAFDELRMHRVQARVLATNEASLRIWAKLGYEEEAVHRDEAFKGGEYVDVIYFGVLEDEWEG